MASIRSLVFLFAVLLMVNARGPNAHKPHKPCQWRPCGPGALCTKINGFDACVCEEGLYGNPYDKCTSTPGCTSNEECPDDEHCRNNLCSSPCFTDCPADGGCVVENHVAICIDDGGVFW